MAGLPDDLRSRALVEAQRWHDVESSNLMNEAADRIDEQAAEIQRLRTGINSMKLRGDMALADEDQPDFDPETPGYQTLVEDVNEYVRNMEIKVTPEHQATRWYKPVPLRIDLPGGVTIWLKLPDGSV